QDVVHVRRVAAAVDLLALLAERRFLAEIIVLAMQVLDALGDHHALGVEPRPAADPVARVHGLAALGRRAEVCAPRLAAGADGLRELLAMRVRAFETAEVGAVAWTFARDEEAHVRMRFLRGRACASQYRSNGRGGDRSSVSIHSNPLDPSSR